MTEFDSNPEQVGVYEIVRLRRICEEYLLEVDGIEPEDVEKIFDDTAGDPGDVVSAVYSYLINLVDDPDERMIKWGILEQDGNTG